MAHPIPWKPLSVTAIRSRLRTRHNELPVHVVPLTSSTQDDAQSALKSGAPHGTVFVAESQTKGRGRHGRRWLTTPGSLLFSLVIRGVATGGDTLGQLTIAVVVSIAQVLEHHTGASALIKWPNDLMFGQAKAGGVLINVQGSDAILGVGLNLYGSAGLADGQATTAVANFANRPFERNALLAVLVDTILDGIDTNSHRSTAVFDEWVSRSAVMGRAVEIQDRTRRIGHVTGFDPSGALFLRETDGSVTKITNTNGSLRVLSWENAIPDTEPSQTP